MKIFNRMYRINTISSFAILILMTYLFAVNASHKFWTHDDKIIEWDVKSYYAYLPAAFIQNDLTFEFLNEKENKSLWKYYWPVKLENGKYLNITSIGMSYIYLPAFIIANNLAEPLGYEPNGYSRPYKFAIVLLAYIYLFIGLFYLRKVLLMYFKDLTVAITLTAITIGTNLFYYATYEAGMTHIYNFTLIVILIYHIIKYYESPSFKSIIILGLLSSLITLIRPTNILVLLFFVFWNISSVDQIKQRLIFFWKIREQIFFMIFMFIIPWIPQFVYWKMQTGHFLFFSYGAKNGKFFFDNPQIFNFLFSYWKGWYVYTPIMFIATIGLIYMLFKDIKKGLILSLYLSGTIYVLSSWWSWWFGGGFGQRSMVDIIGIMAIPLAFLIEKVNTKPFLRIGFLIVIASLIWFNIFQKNQFLDRALHFWSMSKEMYWEQFLEPKPTKKYLSMIKIPDYDAAHYGFYRLIPRSTLEFREKYKDRSKIKVKPEVYLSFWVNQIENNKIDSFILKYPEIRDLKDNNDKAVFLYKQINKGLSKAEIISFFKREIKKYYMNNITKKHQKTGIPIDSIIQTDAIWYYENRCLDENQLLDILLTPKFVDEYLSKEVNFK